MKRHKSILGVALIAAACFCAAMARPPKLPMAQVHTLARDLSHGGAAQSRALAEIQSQLITNAHHTVGPLYKYWIPPLLRRHQYALVDSLALKGILANPGSTYAVQELQMDRVMAMLASGHGNQAMQDARSLFNVCTMQQTKQVLVLIARCFQKAFPYDASRVEELERQQIAGSDLPVNPKEAPRTCAVLEAIHINDKPYMAAAEAITSGSGWKLRGKGNLLLLAGHAGKALRCFRLEASLAADQKHFLAAEKDVDRGIKAQDGTIGRANMHLLSVAANIQKGK